MDAAWLRHEDSERAIASAVDDIMHSALYFGALPDTTSSVKERVMYVLNLAYAARLGDTVPVQKSLSVATATTPAQYVGRDASGMPSSAYVFPYLAQRLRAGSVDELLQPLRALLRSDSGSLPRAVVAASVGRHRAELQEHGAAADEYDRLVRGPRLRYDPLTGEWRANTATPACTPNAVHAYERLVGVAAAPQLNDMAGHHTTGLRAQAQKLAHAVSEALPADAQHSLAQLLDTLNAIATVEANAAFIDALSVRDWESHAQRVVDAVLLGSELHCAATGSQCGISSTSSTHGSPEGSETHPAEPVSLGGRRSQHTATFRRNVMAAIHEPQIATTLLRTVLARPIALGVVNREDLAKIEAVYNEICAEQADPEKFLVSPALERHIRQLLERKGVPEALIQHLQFEGFRLDAEPKRLEALPAR